MKPILSNRHPERSRSESKDLFLPLIFLVMIFLGGVSFADEAKSESSAPSLDFANGLYARKMYGPAISEYQKFIHESPVAEDAASAYFRLADCYYFQKDYARAVQNFQIFQTKYPADNRTPAAFFRIGTAQYFLKNYPAARVALSQVAKTKADDSLKAGALFYLAKTSHAEGKADEAIDTLRGLTEDYPETEYTVYGVLFAGDIFASRKNIAEAIRVYSLVADGTVRPPDASATVTAIEDAILKTADLYFSEKKYAQARTYYQKAYGFEKKTSLERDLLGLFYCDFYLKDLEAAKSLFLANETFLKKSDSRFDINYFLAILAHEKNDPAFSVERLNATLQDAGASADVHAKAVSANAFVNAENLRENGKLAEALAAYEEVIKNVDSPYAPRALYQAGFLSARLKKNADARVYLTKFIAQYPTGDETERAILQKMQMDLDEEKWGNVVSTAQDFLKSFPQSHFTDIALYKLGMGYTGLKQFPDASLTFQQLIKDFKKSQLYPEAVYGAAASFDSAGSAERAINCYEIFTRTYPAHTLRKDALLRLGFLYVQTHQYDKAAQFYENILLSEPQVPLESSVAFWVIRYDLEHSQYDRMKKVLTILSSRYPSEVLTHEINFFLGESLMGLKNYNESLLYYSKAVEAKPDGDYVAYAFLGMGIASEAQGKLDAAENFFVKALGFDSALDVQLRARFELANLQLKRKNSAEAAKAFMHVAILYDDPKYCPAALFKAGECYANLGNKDEAENVFGELIKRYPKTIWARRAEHFLRLKKAAVLTQKKDAA